MDHLARPQSPVENVIEVPFVGMKPYDCGSFLEYPTREGWQKAVQTISQSTHRHFQANWTSFTAFLQRWLFFGLLHVFFLDSFEASEFIHKCSSGEDVLTTASLNERLSSLKNAELAKSQGWEDRLRTRNAALQQANTTLLGLPLQGEDIDGRVHLSLCILFETLFAVNSTIGIATTNMPVEVRLVEGTKLFQAMRRQDWQEPLLEDIRRKILDRLMLVVRPQDHESINTLLVELGAMSQRYESPAVGLPGSMVKLLKDRFQSRGWCPREVQMITQNCNMTCQLFISQIDRPGKLRDHQVKGCDVTECKAYHISYNEYVTEHAEYDCNCNDVAVDNELVYAALQKNKIPVIAVDFREANNLELSVLEADSNTQYIAFSHVWSDGLGNPHRNALPRCQIVRLYKYCCQTRSRLLPFWIDTLCCPVQSRQARAAAIRLMRKTYQEAAVVVVIDAWLHQQQVQSITNVELFMRITLSGWTRRLWTFQEGSINRNVSMIFADRIVDLDSSAGNIRFSDDPSTLPMLRFLLASHAELRTLHLDRSNDIREKFRRLVPCFRYRATSWASDEPICLAVIFGLDAEHIWKARPENRMTEFWDAMTHIPPDVVFFDARKCTQEGFRWAPTTLFGGKQNQSFSNIHATSLPPARKTPGGLVVNLPGLAFSRPTVANLA